MSKIYKVSEVATLPSRGEKGVLYLLRVTGAREAYIWNGHSFVPVCPNDNEWKFHSINNVNDGTWTQADVSDVFDSASEFLVVMTYAASNSTDANLSIVIPNKKIAAIAADKHNYMSGYFYDSSYNGSLMMRFDRNAEKIYPVTSWSKVTGSTNGFCQYEVYYR